MTNVRDGELVGCYDICFSPDDEASTGKGYYVDLLWIRKESPLFRNRVAARSWAVKNGGTRCLRG